MFGLFMDLKWQQMVECQLASQDTMMATMSARQEEMKVEMKTTI
jgi:hypothetical protein